MVHQVIDTPPDKMHEYQTVLAVCLRPGDIIIQGKIGTSRIKDPVIVETATKSGDVMLVTEDGPPGTTLTYGFKKFERLWIQRPDEILEPVNEVRALSAKNALRNLSK